MVLCLLFVVLLYWFGIVCCSSLCCFGLFVCITCVLLIRVLTGCLWCCTVGVGGLALLVAYLFCLIIGCRLLLVVVYFVFGFVWCWFACCFLCVCCF